MQRECVVEGALTKGRSRESLAEDRRRLTKKLKDLALQARLRIGFKGEGGNVDFFCL